MWFNIFTFALIVAGINACSSAGGQLTSTPTFSFSFYPPVSWTFSNDSTKTIFGQWGTANDAKRQIKNDVDSAIAVALKRSGFDGLLSSSSYTTSAYNADEPFPIGTDPGEYIVELDAVTKKVLPIPSTTPAPPARVDTTAPNTRQFQLKITNSPLSFSTDQWQKVADNAYTVLSARYKVRFVNGGIKVSA